MSKFNTKTIARAGIIAALYVALSVVVLPLSSGAIQVRFGEAMTILPLFFPEACVALFLGCVIVNIISGCALFEIITGALITLIASLLTYFLGRIIKNKVLKVVVGGAFPVLLNAFLLPLIWYYCYGELEYIYILQSLLILAGQALAVYGLGSVAYLSLDKILKEREKEGVIK